MAQNWYQKASVQGALVKGLVGGVFLVIAAWIGVQCEVAKMKPPIDIAKESAEQLLEITDQWKELNEALTEGNERLMEQYKECIECKALSENQRAECKRLYEKAEMDLERLDLLLKKTAEERNKLESHHEELQEQLAEAETNVVVMLLDRRRYQKLYEATLSDLERQRVLKDSIAQDLTILESAWIDLRKQLDKDTTDATEWGLTFKKALALHNRAWILQEQGKYEEAIQDYAKAIRLDSSFAKNHQNRAWCYQQLGKYSQAIEDYTRAVELNSNDAKSYHNLAWCFQQLNKYEEAIENYSAAINLNSNDANSYYNRAWCYQQLGMYDDAIEDYTEAIKLRPSDAQVLVERGDLYARMGKLENAIQDYEAAIALNPSYHFLLRRKLRVLRSVPD